MERIVVTVTLFRALVPFALLLVQDWSVGVRIPSISPLRRQQLYSHCLRHPSFQHLYLEKKGKSIYRYHAQYCIFLLIYFQSFKEKEFSLYTSILHDLVIVESQFVLANEQRFNIN